MQVLHIRIGVLVFLQTVIHLAITDLQLYSFFCFAHGRNEVLIQVCHKPQTQN